MKPWEDEMEGIFEELARIKREGGTAALATVISVKGAAPREEGTKMLIRSDGTTLGSIGGGRMEAEVCQEAQEVMRQGKPRMIHFDLTGREAVEEGMICGGVTDVFLEPILSQPTLYVFGAGHISLSLAKMAKMVGFKVVVIDDRSEFANWDRFPEADEIFAEDLSAIFPKLNINKSSYIVIVTRGHSLDEVVLEWAAKTEAGYVGMIGSSKKNKTVFSHLQSRGMPQELLQRVHAPIGLDIGAETPEEISVSILAEIIKVRRGVGETVGLVASSKNKAAQSLCEAEQVTD